MDEYMDRRMDGRIILHRLRNEKCRLPDEAVLRGAEAPVVSDFCSLMLPDSAKARIWFGEKQSAPQSELTSSHCQLEPETISRSGRVHSEVQIRTGLLWTSGVLRLLYGAPEAAGQKNTAASSANGVIRVTAWGHGFTATRHTHDHMGRLGGGVCMCVKGGRRNEAYRRQTRTRLPMNLCYIPEPIHLLSILIVCLSSPLTIKMHIIVYSDRLDCSIWFC